MNKIGVLHLSCCTFGIAALTLFIGCGDNTGTTATSNGQGASGASGQTGGGGSGGDAGSSSGGQGGQGQGGQGQGGQGGGPVPNGVPMFIAQGHVGRTTVSCDDGLTWVADRSDDNTPNYCELTGCDHIPTTASGIGYGAGYFIATFGHGPIPGTFRRTRNGTDWESVAAERDFAGVNYDGVGRFLGGSLFSYYSDDFGLTWIKSTKINSAQSHVRRSAFAPTMGGRFLLAIDTGGVQDTNYSSDGGLTWLRPTTLPAGCGAGIANRGGLAYGKGAIVEVGGDGVACVSKDGGDTWVKATIGTAATVGQLIWDGKMFVVWGKADNGQGGTFPARFTSPDGLTWTATASMVRSKDANGMVVTGPGPTLGAVQRSATTGTYVGALGGPKTAYAAQTLYRSTDGGITWDTLEAGTYVKSHPLLFIAFGWGEPGGACK